MIRIGPHLGHLYHVLGVALDADHLLAGVLRDDSEVVLAELLKQLPGVPGVPPQRVHAPLELVGRAYVVLARLQRCVEHVLAYSCSGDSQ